ncbi:MAG: NAD(P)/FAD-dependent oxidoreductase [Pyrinomonadaceae bacterium]
MEQYDTVVIGAGLGGLQCSRQLSSKGVRVLLVDRKSTLARAVHTTGIFVRRTLEDFDLPDKHLGPPVRHVTLYSPARRTMELKSSDDEFRVGRMGPLYHYYLDQCINAGVTWLPGTRYAGIEADGAAGDFSIVRLEKESTTLEVRTRFIVGADGAMSRVAHDLQLDANTEMIVGLEEVLENVPLEGPPRFHCFLDPVLSPGYVAWIVHDGEEVHLGVGGYASHFDPIPALEVFRASVENIVDLSQARRVERRGGRIPVGGVLRHLSNRQGLLVGDAAGAVSPLTAGGLDPCMRMSALAARVIENYLSTGNPDALKSYSGKMFRSHFFTRIMMRRMVSAIHNPSLIELGCASMRLPIFKRVAEQVFFGRGSFPDIEPAAVQPLTT